MIKRNCKIENCSGEYWAKDFCRYHYYKLFWNKNNKDRIKLHRINHYKKYRERLISKSRERYQNNKNTLNYKFGEYKQAAKKTNKEFNLTIKDFKLFWEKPCYYCGNKIETIGLDRIDNSKGYIKGNIVSCCIRCNKMKKNFDYTEFIKLCRIIAKKSIPFPR